ncbi:MAG: hypothetical protein KDD84_21340 [Caldilineaceae bacterium]|nr:hypothetical protein [Caldilineaceae bacterium]
MNEPFVYEICIEGQLSDCWSDWFDNMTIHNDAGSVTTLRGLVVDQSALFGLLNKLQSLNLALISVNRVSPFQPA